MKLKRYSTSSDYIAEEIDRRIIEMLREMGWQV